MQIRSIGIQESDQTKLEFYPNPVYERITILGSEAELQEIYIYNLTGQKVRTEVELNSNDQNRLVIDMSSLKTGIYFLKTNSVAFKVYKN